MSVCLGLVQHAVLERGGNADHKFYGMLFGQRNPKSHGVAFVLTHTIAGACESPGIQENILTNSVSSSTGAVREPCPKRGKTAPELNKSIPKFSTKKKPAICGGVCVLQRYV